MIVVAGVDASNLSLTVAARAGEEARRRGAELHAVHVFHPPSLVADGLAAFPLDIGAVAASERKAVWDRVLPVLENSAAAFTTVELEGYPPDVLVHYCQAQEAAVLVIGTRGRGELASLIMGSTSHRALHMSTCDVLVVKPSHPMTHPGASQMPPD